jgi:hypothetical protein
MSGQTEDGDAVPMALQELVKRIVAENQAGRSQWQQRLAEMTAALVEGRDLPDLPIDRFEEIMGDVNDDGEEISSGQDD